MSEIILKDGEVLRISVRVGFVRILFMRNHGTPAVRYEFQVIGLKEWAEMCDEIGVIPVIAKRVDDLRQTDWLRDARNN